MHARHPGQCRSQGVSGQSTQASHLVMPAGAARHAQLTMLQSGHGRIGGACSRVAITRALPEKRRKVIMACQPQATAPYKMLNPTQTPARANPQTLRNSTPCDAAAKRSTARHAAPAHTTLSPRCGACRSAPAFGALLLMLAPPAAARGPSCIRWKLLAARTVHQRLGKDSREGQRGEGSGQGVVQHI